MEQSEYISVKQMSEITGYKTQSIYNMIHKKTFILNQHYFKPTPKKIVFKWAAVKQWIEGGPTQNSESGISPINNLVLQACDKQEDIANENSTQNKINI